jgi:hypothetical protein
MGMFDYISVADKLPISDEMSKLGLDKNVFVFQTKNMHCCMDNYIIQGGKLLEIKYKTTRWVDDASSFSSGWIERDGEYFQDTNYHGVINFYHSEKVDNLDCWIEYSAKFTDGSLIEFKLEKFTTADNTEKKKRLKEIFEASRVYRSRWYNKYIFHTTTWRKIRKPLSDILYWMQNMLQYLRSNLP